MSIDEILVIIAGVLGLAFTFWFFLMKKEEAVEAGNSVDIVVKGGYKPEVIKVKKDRKTILNFLRHDPSSCLEEVVVSDFRIRKFLPLHEKVSITITPHRSGEFLFSCGMNMFHGKLIVED